MKNVIVLMFAVLTVAACGHRRPSEAELRHKLDSIKALEVKRQMRLRGIQLEETSPVQMFYDSLKMQAMPVMYSANYVRFLPSFTPVPVAIKAYLQFEGREQPKAIALPETMNMRLMLLAADVADDAYELWLYSLDTDCMPVDKLLLYRPPLLNGTQIRKDTRDAFFSITTDFDIHVMEYDGANDRKGRLNTYVVDSSRHFIKLDK